MRLGAGLYVLPFMFVYRPGLLLMDTFGGIVFATVISIVGIIGLVAGLNGYLLTKAKIWERIILGVGGILVTFPGWTTILGLIMVAVGAVTQTIARTAAKRLEGEAVRPKEIS
jgi:TRAP-type uncharacterized transport system fused permease subunit